MPARKTVAAPKKPSFSFKSIKKNSSNGSSSPSGASSSSAPSSYRSDKPTKTSLHEAIIQSGDREGEKSGRRYFVVNPRYGLNDAAKELLEPHVLKVDKIRPFNKDLGGFPVLVHAPKQAQEMHTALRNGLDRGKTDLPEKLNVGSWTRGPTVTVVTLHNVDIKTRDQEHAEVTALMLESEASVYPIKEHLKKDVEYEFVRGVHGKNGIDKWVRVVEDSENTADLVKATAKVLADRGWQCETAELDAADWEDDDE